MKLKIIMDSGKEYLVDVSDAVYKSLDDAVHGLIQKAAYIIPVNEIHTAIIVNHISSIEQII